MSTYQDNDLDAAVAAGALSAEAAEALRQHLKSRAPESAVDEENFRLLSGFNDIFVAIAGLLLLIGAAWICKSLDPGLPTFVLALLAWGLSEYFTRIRRMALPSILFSFVFIIDFAMALSVVTALVIHAVAPEFVKPIPDKMHPLIWGAPALLGAWLYWKRFHVPITVAIGTAALVGVIQVSVLLLDPNAASFQNLLSLILGIAIFFYAMWWDRQDPNRTTNKSDVAFWLHLLAAPLIAHSIFTMLGLFNGVTLWQLNGAITPGTAFLVVLLYALMGIVALMVDRRALLVSGLLAVTLAIVALFREFGSVSLNVALAIFVIGSTLLVLSAFWHGTRMKLLACLPEALRKKLPPLGGSAAKLPNGP